MIDLKDVRAFFDERAEGWDAQTITDVPTVEKILDTAGVGPGRRVLDVACGTGVLIPFYLARDVAAVTGVDLSANMIALAREKFRAEEKARFLCGDALSVPLEAAFDCVVVYNAFPHFPEPERLIARLSSLLVPGGTLTVAHSMSRAQIDRHHCGEAKRVSNGLPESETLAAVFARTLRVTAVISADHMYQVVGVRD